MFFLSALIFLLFHLLSIFNIHILFDNCANLFFGLVLTITVSLIKISVSHGFLVVIKPENLFFL